MDPHGHCNSTLWTSAQAPLCGCKRSDWHIMYTATSSFGDLCICAGLAYSCTSVCESCLHVVASCAVSHIHQQIHRLHFLRLRCAHAVNAVAPSMSCLTHSTQAGVAAKCELCYCGTPYMRKPPRPNPQYPSPKQVLQCFLPVCLTVQIQLRP